MVEGCLGAQGAAGGTKRGGQRGGLDNCAISCGKVRATKTSIIYNEARSGIYLWKNRLAWSSNRVTGNS